jgi:ATP-dependent Lhr-like helicase
MSSGYWRDRRIFYFEVGARGSVTLGRRNLELVMIKDMTVLVRKSNSKKSIVPSWQGGRMPLSANLGKKLREKFNEALIQFAERRMLN